MKLLLDTHALLWTLFDPSKLGRQATEKILRVDNEVFVSVISFWEISLKYALGKLELAGVEPEELPEYAKKMGLDILTLEPGEAASFHKLPRLGHKDPFDRLIVCQAIHRELILVTRDRELAQYGRFGLVTLW